MLLKEFEQIVEIDSTIIDLHKKLEEFYKKRSIIFDSTLTSKNSNEHTQIVRTPTLNDASIRSERQRYDDLAQGWKAVGVTIPTFTSLKNKLTRAATLLNACHKANPECAFKIALLPPSSIYKTANPSESFKYSHAVAGQKRKPRNWKLYVVATNPEGLIIKDTDQFIKEGGMQVGDVFMTGLNTYEYSVFLGMLEQPIDKVSWSILVRDVDTKLNLVPCVTYLSGVYNFEVDNTDVLIGKNHFRPAKEVK